MSKYADEVAKRLCLLIEELGEGRQNKFAKKLDIRAATVNRWLVNGGVPSAEQLTNMRKKLKININWLLTGDGPIYLDEGLKGKSLTKKALAVAAGYDAAEPSKKEVVELTLKIRKASGV